MQHRDRSHAVEALEGRRFLTTTFAFNFQPAAATAVAGYFADAGRPFGVQTGGASYGWNFSLAAETRDRNAASAPDQRYDTFVHLQRYAGSKWELAVPAGTYRVKVVAGDPSYTDSVNQISVEGVTAVNADMRKFASRWVEGTVDVTVADGRLTIAPGTSAQNAKLAFVTVEQLNSPLTVDPAVRAQLQQVLAFADGQLRRTVATLNNDPTKYVVSTNQTTGAWNLTNAGDWAAGFLPGQMWQMYRATGDATWKANAAKWTTPLAPYRNQQGDLAFKFLTTYQPLFDTTLSKADRQVMLDAAYAKNQQWSDAVGAFRTGWYTGRAGDPNATFAVLMDQTTDMELLLWAFRQTGNTQYRDRAVAHTLKVIANQVRPDGSTAQFGMYNPTTGAFVRNESYQGYANDSVWSRGQAWAVLSFTAVARETGNADVLAAAKKVADYVLNNAPADGVPFWDYSDPAIPSTYRDSSAAAVAASGLIQLARLLIAGGDPSQQADATRYFRFAEKILTTLSGPAYLAQGTVHQGLLVHAAGNVPNNVNARDTSLTYGDYYFLDAVNRYLWG